MQQAMAQDQAEQAAAQTGLRNRLRDEYVQQIVGTVRRNWIRPRAIQPIVQCTVLVSQIPGARWCG